MGANGVAFMVENGGLKRKLAAILANFGLSCLAGISCYGTVCTGRPGLRELKYDVDLPVDHGPLQPEFLDLLSAIEQRKVKIVTGSRVCKCRVI